MIANPNFSFSNSSAPSANSPFSLNYVSPWMEYANSPEIDDVNFTSSPASAKMWAASPNMFEGIYQHISGLEINKPYIFSIKARKYPGFPDINQLKIFVTDHAYTAALNNNLTLGGTLQPVLYINNISDTVYNDFFTCNFIPTQSWQDLVIHPENWTSQPPVQFVNFDDVVLVPNFGFAGRDTFICIAGSPIPIGVQTCSGLSGFAFEWYEDSIGSTIISTNAQDTVYPFVTTNYIIKRTYLGCVSYDTLNVRVVNILQPDLGTDIVICDSPGVYTLSTSFQDSTLYRWQPYWTEGEGLNLHIATQSGTYIVTVIKDGCELSDSIDIIFLPQIEVTPDTIRLCNNDSVTFCATPGMASYTWSNGATTSCIRVHASGTYTVLVTDSNGCWAESYGVLYRGESFKTDLGPDINICSDTCLNLKPRIRGSSASGGFTYIWSNSSTDSLICVDTTGLYWVCITDSFNCVSCDSILVIFNSKIKPSASHLGPICLYDTPSILSHGSPSGGIYNGKGVYNNTFHPKLAGLGIHQIIYTYTTDSGCSDTVIFNIEVIDGPYAELMNMDACDTDSSLVIPLSNQTGITGTWSANAPGGLFNPALAGPGVHEVTYTIIDTTTGCTYIAKAKVRVGTIYTADYHIITEGWQCEGKSVKVEALFGYRFIWINVETGDTIGFNKIEYLPSNGNYQLYVMDSIGNCPPSIVSIPITLPSCCEQEPATFGFDEVENSNFDDDVYVQQGNALSIGNAQLCFDKSIVVPYGYTLTLTNCDIIMKNCSKILVENGAKLVLDNTEIGYCEWQGIEAGGWYDCCQGFESGNCKMSASNCTVNSEVAITHSRIHHADIGVMAGYREGYTTGCTFVDETTSGGALLTITNSQFSHNYVDLLFREYDNPSMAPNPCGNINGEINRSKIDYNSFVKPKDTYCGILSDSLLYRISQIGRCHIVDFAETSRFYVSDNISPHFGGKGQNLRGNLSHYGLINFYSRSSMLIPNINYNHYTNQCSKIKFYK